MNNGQFHESEKGLYATVDICNILFPVIDYQKALTIFSGWIGEESPHQVCIANVHTVVTCLWDEELGEITKAAHMVTMDGHPLRWYANIVHGAAIRDRVSGPELMIKSIEYGLMANWRHYFLGGKDDVLENLVNRLKKLYPEIRIAGFYSPPFRPLSSEEDKELVQSINSTKPDLLWVGLGAPKQEKWIYHHLNRVRVPVQIGVGAAFDFHSGNIRRAPLLYQKYGIEWLFRICQDPRLWKRYLKTNPVFIGLFLKDLVKIRLLNNGNHK